ncbi:ABC transporter substrate-binding protein [Phaeobacter gallaeciensis]|uniref:Amino acid/amide ABC transporter substrate-binding protein, HAAT family n=1 Tax=Phaeobacter gallaeciensis TaxID=60890 RepID=A0AAD0EEX9_9RHOB|nr:ABC transporter substrate-binding protein [Phaeobacter gallaeciensis]AHD11897.1 amino acid/amide ABC transporter substrate-binding protein, HAAT family [Phaeobacter gallaeciensis DSM 26640]ATE95160.1 amino acid/amide ABC transporter substrate-binding protein, HAAT family [Phaeobacter gallaeciensis]ATE99468.1 amino acid/amide ABC transporter substrate-binding protein, HAAT family [Phaeobacter gallaeciensis]ATF03865.1 amino acid/amide ABC transporter substrate-binding protein, HAAT family [Pha
MLTRRTLLKTGAAAGATALAMPALAKGGTVKIGYVSPQSGPLSAFSEADAYVIEQFKKTSAANGLNVEVIVKDSQSNPNRAAEVARELIVRDEVNLICVASTPETTNPVCTIAEAEEIPVISSVAPWQPWFIGQQGNPGDPSSWQEFDYVYHFFWGLEDNVSVFLNMWNSIESNKVLGALWPNDGDGNAWASGVGMPPAAESAGYQLIDPGRYQNLTDDFSAQINAYKNAGADIFTGIPIPPDFTTFWTQAKQQGYNPKLASIAKALLFPESVQQLGDLGNNLTCEVYWTPSFPFTSSLTGESSADLAAGFEAAAKRQWTQPVGFTHALFEVAANAIQRTEDPTDGDALAEAIASTDLNTVVGHIGWGKDNLPPFAQKNVAKTPLVGGQWRRKDSGDFELLIVENGNAPEIPLDGTLETLT